MVLARTERQGKAFPSDLRDAAALIGWPSPMAADGERASEQGVRGESNPTLLGAARMAAWPTPDTGRDESLETFFARQERMKIRHPGKGMGTPLGIVAQLVGRPTPMAGSPGTEDYNEAGNNDSSRRTLDLLAGWQTPTAEDASGRGYTYPNGNHDKPFLALPGQALLTGWGTPTTRDAKDGACGDAEVKVGAMLGRQAAMLTTGTPSDSSTAPTRRGVAFRLNCRLSSWLMGYPLAWLACGLLAASETTRLRKQRRKGGRKS